MKQGAKSLARFEDSRRKSLDKNQTRPSSHRTKPRRRAQLDLDYLVTCHQHIMTARTRPYGNSFWRPSRKFMCVPSVIGTLATDKPAPSSYWHIYMPLTPISHPPTYKKKRLRSSAHHTMPITQSKTCLTRWKMPSNMRQPATRHIIRIKLSLSLFN